MNNISNPIPFKAEAESLVEAEFTKQKRILRSGSGSGIYKAEAGSEST